MVVTNQYRRVPCKDIIINRTERQRTAIDTSGLKESIAIRGVMVPILITKDLQLVAGERRLTSSLELALPDIPCRFVADGLSQSDLQIIELEENLRRADLSWQDQVNAIGRLNALYQQLDPDWTATATADQLGLSISTISNTLRIFAEMGDPKVAAMPTAAAARNFLFRKDERGVDNAFSLIMETGLQLGNKMLEAPLEVEASTDSIKSSLPNVDASSLIGLLPGPKPSFRPVILPAEESLLHTSFLEWAPTYTGEKFNFLHCDFPYGVGLFEGKKSGLERAETTYNDEEGVFWALLLCLCQNRERLMQASCHIMFWFSMDYYPQIYTFFAQHAPEFIINAFPLIWHKSDGSGITPDPRRGPKRCYETALLLYRGDRPVVRSIGNFYAAPTDKKYHPSTKPEPMLRQFFQLFVDEHTKMLDPTCGGGSSLRAAESMGAKLVLGLERDPTFYKNACEALKNFRILAAGSKKANV
jgi:ParB/RepB/Spo0J family partition protein